MGEVGVRAGSATQHRRDGHHHHQHQHSCCREDTHHNDFSSVPGLSRGVSRRPRRPRNISLESQRRTFGSGEGGSRVKTRRKSTTMAEEENDDDDDDTMDNELVLRSDRYNMVLLVLLCTQPFLFLIFFFPINPFLFLIF